MRKLRAFVAVAILILIIVLLNRSTRALPAMGKLLSPSQGLWQNAENHKKNKPKVISINAPNEKVSVYYDDRAIPHLFAENEEDLLFTQGYIIAKDRLWQMELQTLAAAGRISEIVGNREEALEHDRLFRRLGLAKIAKETVETFENDEDKYLIQAFTNGINMYINSIKPKNLPIEYKLMGYKPEPWSLEKSVLLQKIMAHDLSGRDYDIEFTNALNLLGKEMFEVLYPDFPKGVDPIIPSSKSWNFNPIRPIPLKDTSFAQMILHPTHKIAPKNIGSNNWAVSGKKTASGAPILCNDPHLGLTFPSIWYEMQLSCPTINVYGVTIPGAPGIIIGFNERIAWGVTNSSWDVRDWYKVDFKPGDKDYYQLGNEYIAFEKRIEVIKVKGHKDFIDTVLWTVVGPIVYDQSFGDKNDKQPLAMNWQALETSNEAKTFLKLNKAQNHSDYLEALEHYTSPAQNFVYADIDNNIAIKQNGKYKVQSKDGGKFVTELKNINLKALDNYIPYKHLPYIKNPYRNFVASANQHPTTSRYPYYYNGIYEYYRNRRINNQLKKMKNARPVDMMHLQNDNYYLMAAENLPFMLRKIDINKLDNHKNRIFQSLKKWDFDADYKYKAPSYFQQWWIELKAMIWDELQNQEVELIDPEDYTTAALMRQQPNHIVFDIKATSDTESVSDLISTSFDKMCDHFKILDVENHVWQKYKHTAITHLSSLSAFSKNEIPIGGHGNCVNAADSIWGPSWRMIVELKKDNIEAYGVYPGGQSGNPGSKNYDNFVDKWAAGEYYKLHFFTSEEEAKSLIKK